jgi:hypothetical protein
MNRATAGLSVRPFNVKIANRNGRTGASTGNIFTSDWEASSFGITPMNRKIVDTSFMIGFMFPHDVNISDVEKYRNGMRRAQMDLDLEPEKYKHFYMNEIPDRYEASLDVRRFSPGERIVFLPYTETTFARTQAWLHERKLFEVQAPLVA